MEIRPYKELTEDALKELYKFQTGQKRIVRTGFDSVDSHLGGMLNGDFLLFSGLSGHGKSETIFELKDNFLSTELNPEAKDFVTLDMSLEMRVFNIVLRSLHRKMTKSKKKILFEKFTEEEQKIAKKYFEDSQDDRQYISQTPATPEELYKGLKQFLTTHKDKKAVLVIIDHILLLSGNDKKGVIDNTVEYLNQLKLEFDNLYVCIVSQLNRSVLSRVSEKNNSAMPTSADLYGSEFMQQAASYSIIIFNAFKVGIQQFLKVNPDFYEHLSEHFGDVDQKNNKVSFNTIGKLFHIVTKVREGDAVIKEVFIKNMRMEESVKEQLTLKPSLTSTPSFSTQIPKFESIPVYEPPTPTPIFNLKDAFD